MARQAARLGLQPRASNREQREALRNAEGHQAYGQEVTIPSLCTHSQDSSLEKLVHQCLLPQRGCHVTHCMGCSIPIDLVYVMHGIEQNATQLQFAQIQQVTGSSEAISQWFPFTEVVGFANAHHLWSFWSNFICVDVLATDTSHMDIVSCRSHIFASYADVQPWLESGHVMVCLWSCCWWRRVQWSHWAGTHNPRRESWAAREKKVCACQKTKTSDGMWPRFWRHARHWLMHNICCRSLKEVLDSNRVLSSARHGHENCNRLEVTEVNASVRFTLLLIRRISNWRRCLCNTTLHCPSASRKIAKSC